MYFLFVCFNSGLSKEEKGHMPVPTFSRYSNVVYADYIVFHLDTTNVSSEVECDSHVNYFVDDSGISGRGRIGCEFLFAGLRVSISRVSVIDTFHS